MTKEIIIFENDEMTLEVKMKDETVWLTQAQMAELFGKDRKTITRHIQNIYKEELEENVVCSFFEHTANDNKKYKVQYYNLLYKDNKPTIDNNTLVAITLLIT